MSCDCLSRAAQSIDWSSKRSCKLQFSDVITPGSQTATFEAAVELDLETLPVVSVLSGDLARLSLIEALPTHETLYWQA